VKAVYVAPNKALVQERVADWQKRFSYLGIQVMECTGDTEQRDEARLMTADLIATTPYVPICAHLLSVSCDMVSNVPAVHLQCMSATNYSGEGTKAYDTLDIAVDSGSRVPAYTI
jgi:hypothetical protein